MTYLDQIKAAKERGDRGEMLRLCRAGLAEQGQKSSERALLCSYLGDALWDLNDFAEAAEAYQEAIENLVASNYSAVRVGTVRLARALVLYSAERFQEALEEARRVFLESEESLGAEYSKKLWTTSLKLCLINLKALGLHEPALTLARELRERAQSILGAEAPETVETCQLIELAEAEFDPYYYGS